MKAVLLASGGLDSTVVGAQLRETEELAACLFLAYGQPARAQERRASKAQAALWGVPWEERDLELFGVEAMRAPTGEPGPRVVPARNLALIAAGVNYALSIGANTVAIGCSGADKAEYADCRHDFLLGLEATTICLGVELHAPLLWTCRAEVRAMAEALGVERGETWSCYTPKDGRPCRTCGSCRQDFGAPHPDSMSGGREM